MLKSEIEIAPGDHRFPERIRAHALICFLALVLYRVLRMRLKASEYHLSPEHALEIARRIQHHQVTLHRNQSSSGLTTVTALYRLGTADEIAKVLLFLASDCASYSSGTCIEITSGKFCLQNPADAWI